MNIRIGAAGFLAAMIITTLLAVPAMAQQTSPEAPVVSTSADNTRVNQRDKSPETVKPTDQPNNKTDIKLAAAVRRSIVSDKSLSMMAHNVKLVAIGGVVTLRGPVKTAEEKTKVGAIVAKVAGVADVNNELDIKH